MLNLLSFAANSAAYVVLVVRIVLAVLALVAAGFITFVVMKQSGNTDGMEAMTGSYKQSDDLDDSNGKTRALVRKQNLSFGLTLPQACLPYAALQC